MDAVAERKLEEFRSDFEAVTGEPFFHFFCPILFRDENVPLCRAHFVNRVFPEASNRWTIQRADVDNFFGRVFEADFTDIQYHPNKPIEQFFIDPGLSRRFRPRILMGGQDVQYFVPSGPVPTQFTEILLGGPSGEVRLGLKLEPDLAQAQSEIGCTVAVERDLRIPAVASLLKAAHLTLFHLLGYRYALSPAGILLGFDILGEFFLRSEALKKADVIERASRHFGQFSRMVRPVASEASSIRGTIEDGFVLVCFSEPGVPWAFVVFIRTGDDLHAVLAPAFDGTSGAAQFVGFLRGAYGRFAAHRSRFAGNKWEVSQIAEDVIWPVD